MVCDTFLLRLKFVIHLKVELLKTPLGQVGLWSNWYGLPKALIGTYIPFLRDYIPSDLLAQIGGKSDNIGVPFVLTEEFAAVYRLHSLSPPGLIVGEGTKKEFIPLLDLFTEKGAEAFHKTPERPTEIAKSCFSFPFGGLMRYLLRHDTFFHIMSTY